MALYGAPADIALSYSATWSLAVGTADTAFPLANLASRYAHVVSKTTGTTATYRATIASTALQAIGIINCNLAGLTLVVTNNNSMASTNLVIPAAPTDNVSINGWVDLRAVTTAATQWNIAITGAAANIAIGKIILVSTLSTMTVKLAARVPERKPTRVLQTEYGIKQGARKGVRYRSWDVAVGLESERAAYINLRRGSEGPTQPFFFVLESAVNDPAYGWFPQDTWTLERSTNDVSQWSDRIEEANPGMAL